MGIISLIKSISGVVRKHRSDLKRPRLVFSINYFLTGWIEKGGIYYQHLLDEP